MSIIKNWIKAFLICKKHNIKWNPFHHLKGAECSYSFDDMSMTVRINPFYPEFMTSFMHEIGHLKRWDKIYKKCFALWVDSVWENKAIRIRDSGVKGIKPKASLDPVTNFKMKTDCILTEEFFAWKYSKRFLKRSFNRDRAKEYFKTYLPTAAKYIGPVQAYDKYLAYDKRI